MEWRKGSFTISTDRERLDVDWVQRQLSTSYWAQGRSRETVAASIVHSICFGLYERDSQIGFARVVTDRAVMGYLADVIIAPERRGSGLGKWLVECVFSHPELRHCKILLETKDAHGLYERYGFARAEAMLRPPAQP